MVELNRDGGRGIEIVVEGAERDREISFAEQLAEEEMKR